MKNFDALNLMISCSAAKKNRGLAEFRVVNDAECKMKNAKCKRQKGKETFLFTN